MADPITEEMIRAKEMAQKVLDKPYSNELHAELEKIANEIIKTTDEYLERLNAES